MFDTSHQSGFFDGPQRTATITTREYMFDPTQRSRLRGFRPLVRGGAENTSITGRVGFRNNPIMDPKLHGPIDAAIRRAAQLPHQRKVPAHRVDGGW